MVLAHTFYLNPFRHYEVNKYLSVITGRVRINVQTNALHVDFIHIFIFISYHINQVYNSMENTTGVC